MRKGDVMMQCSYNNVLNGMILPDDVNAQSKRYGMPSRRWVFYDNKRDFWWQNTYTHNQPEGKWSFKRNWRRKRKRLLTWHYDSKLAPNLRRGNYLLIWNFTFYKEIISGNIERQPSRLVDLTYWLLIYVDDNKGLSKTFIDYEIFHHSFIDQLDMIFYDDQQYDEDEGDNLDDRNHLFTKKFWRNYIPDYAGEDIFGP